MYNPILKKALIPFFLITVLLFGFKANSKIISKQNSVLVFSATKGFRHASIPYGIKAIQKLGIENGFAVDASEDVNVFTLSNLKKYKLLSDNIVKY